MSTFPKLRDVLIIPIVATSIACPLGESDLLGWIDIDDDIWILILIALPVMARRVEIIRQGDSQSMVLPLIYELLNAAKPSMRRSLDFIGILV